MYQKPTQCENLKSLREVKAYGFGRNEEASDYLRKRLMQQEAIPSIVDYILDRINNGRGSLIVITGTMGTGKTTFGRQLSAALKKGFKRESDSIELSVLDGEEADF